MDKITVIGSYNVGLFLKGEAIPKIGETLTGTTFLEGGGGKGSNQAIAASRLGGNVSFIGCVGNDHYGKYALELYEKNGVSSNKIKVAEDIHTGISVIFIDKEGQNSIMIVPGANYRLNENDITSETLKDSYIAGFQLETTPQVVYHGLRLASEMGIKTLLDPAPVIKLSDNIYPYISIIKPNEHEASMLSGIKVTDVASAFSAGEWFIKKGVSTALITLGSQGAVMVSPNERKHFPAMQVDTVDSTGAGDCFSGALMKALADGYEMSDAITYANAASAISTTRLGVVEALPIHNEVMAFINRIQD